MSVIISGGGGNAIDVTSLTPFQGETSLTSSGSWQNLVSITGKGFINTCVVACNAAIPVQIRITIDGIIQVNQTSGASPNLYVGLAQKNDLYASTNVGYVGVRGTKTSAVYGVTMMQSLPATVNANAIAVVGYPVYFKQSLLVEVSIGGAGNTILYRYDGGS